MAKVRHKKTYVKSILSPNDSEGKRKEKGHRRPLHTFHLEGCGKTRCRNNT